MGALLGAPKDSLTAFLCQKDRHRGAVGNCHRTPSAGKSRPGSTEGLSDGGRALRTHPKPTGKLSWMPFRPSPSEWLGRKGIRAAHSSADRRALTNGRGPSCPQWNRPDRVLFYCPSVPISRFVIHLQLLFFTVPINKPIGQLTG